MSQALQNFISKNFKYLITIGCFLISFYIQGTINTRTIEELKKQNALIEQRVSDQEVQINSLKIDRAVYQSTIEQVSLIRDDIKELRSDVKELLKK